jgi:hypothetical protein
MSVSYFKAAVCGYLRDSSLLLINYPFVFVIENVKLGIVLFAGRLSHVLTLQVMLV